MITRGATLLSRAAAIFVMLFAFTACGGGGGGGGGDGFLGGGGGNGSDGLQLTLLDPQGNETNSVSSASPGTLRVAVRGGNNKDVVVTVESNIGLVFPASGTALTNDNGVATFQIEAGPDRGAGVITATANRNGETLSGSLSFQVGESGLVLGYFAADGTFLENQLKIEPGSTLSAGGNAQLSVVILNAAGERVTTVEEVRFSSGCIAAGQATINPAAPAQSVNGQASTLYTATGCAGVDEITASLEGASAQAFGTLTVAAATTNAIQFVSAEPTLIVLRGTGGANRDETSDVIFRVVDGNGLPLQGVTVNFSLTTEVGGLALSTDSVLSGGDGQVAVSVQAGDIATVVRVIATVAGSNGENVSTVSDQLTVTTGLPDQNSISLAIGGCDGGDEASFVVDGAMTIDGLCRSLNVAMADKFNNPVVDGTAAVFTTEYGSIVGSCSTVGGTCGVEWRSQEPRFPTLTGDDFVKTIFDADYDCPSHNGNSGPCPDDLGYIRGGRSTVLVHAIGEESFIDRNGNGILDEAERDLFSNLSEAFIDQNEDGVYTPGLANCAAAPMGSSRCIAGQEEIFIDFNDNNQFDLNDSPAVYNGLLCPPAGDGVWCSRDLVHVRDWHVVTLGDAPNFQILLTRNGNVVDHTVAGRNQTAYIADTYNNPPPGGSTVELSTDGNCEVVGFDSDEVPNYAISLGNGAYPIGIQTVIDPTDPEPGVVIVTLTTPIVEKQWAFECRGDGTPVDPCDPVKNPSPLPGFCMDPNSP